MGRGFGSQRNACIALERSFERLIFFGEKRKRSRGRGYRVRPKWARSGRRRNLTEGKKIDDKKEGNADRKIPREEKKWTPQGFLVASSKKHAARAKSRSARENKLDEPGSLQKQAPNLGGQRERAKRGEIRRHGVNARVSYFRFSFRGSSAEQQTNTKRKEERKKKKKKCLNEIGAC